MMGSILIPKTHLPQASHGERLQRQPQPVTNRSSLPPSGMPPHLPADTFVRFGDNNTPGKPPSTTNNTGQFIRAIREDNLDEIKKLVQQGLDINQPTAYGEYPLLETIRPKSLPVFEYLLAQGAQLNVVNRSGETPLMRSIRRENLAVFEKLLSHGVDIHQETKLGSALGQAAQINNMAIAQRLLSKGASPNLAGQEARSPLAEAVRHKNTQMVRLLLAAGADPAPQQPQKLSPINAAAQGGHLQLLNQLIALGASPETKDITGETPLFYAVERGHLEIVERLFRLDASLLATNQENKTVLELNNSTYNNPVLKRLLAHPDITNLPPEVYSRALSRCLMQGNIEGAHALLAFNPDVNVRDRENGIPPLIYALLLPDNATIVEALLQRGADPNAPGPNNTTPIHYLLLRNSGLGRDLESITASLLAYGANPNHETREGHTPLFAAIALGYNTVIKQLLKAGADPNHRSREERETPLMMAAHEINLEAAQQLLHYGVDPDALNLEGRSAMYIVQSGRQVLKRIITQSPFGRELYQEPLNRLDEFANLLKAYGATSVDLPKTEPPFNNVRPILDGFDDFDEIY